MRFAEFAQHSERTRREVADTVALHLTPAPNDTMATVYMGVVRALGFDPIRLGEVDALVSVLRKAPRARTWKDAKSEPLGDGKATLEARAAQIFEAHPYLKIPLTDATTVGQMLDAFDAVRVANIDPYRAQVIPFLTLDARLPAWRTWTWETWDGLSDQDFDEWERGVINRLGTYASVVRKSIDRMGTVGTALEVAKGGAELFAKGARDASAKKVQDGDVTLSLFSVNIRIPQAVLLFIFCLSPMLYALSVSLLRMLQLRQRLAAVELARAEKRLADMIGHPFVAPTVDPEVMTSRVEWDYVKAREWGKLFQNNPELFSDIFFTVANATLVAMLVGVVVHVAHGLNDDRKVVIVVASSVLGLGIDVLSRRVAAAALDEGLTPGAASSWARDRADATRRASNDEQRAPGASSSGVTPVVNQPERSTIRACSCDG